MVSILRQNGVIADMHAAPGLAEKGVRLAKDFRPTAAFPRLDRATGRVDSAFERVGACGPV